MKVKSYAPTGNRISLLRSKSSPESLFKGYGKEFLDSGTSALSIALQHISFAHHKPEEELPEVIVPAYCCPDLVAAALHAGYKPVVVDISKNDPSYDLEGFSAALTENTRAVIAVNFLGIKERFSEIRSIIGSSDIKVIEDNAQWFPETEEQETLSGDYATFSFGRGKALSLLGGGLVCVKNGAISSSSNAVCNASDDSLWIAKVLLIDFLTMPLIYRWVELLPFLNLGQTKFHELRQISGLSSNRKRRVVANVEQYRQRKSASEEIYIERLTEINELSVSKCRRGRLLRYPFLFKNKDQRDNAYREATYYGLGASIMYGRSLPYIDGIAQLEIDTGEYNNAESFSARLLTLPTHSRISPTDALRLVEIVTRNFERETT